MKKYEQLQIKNVIIKNLNLDVGKYLDEKRAVN